MRTNQPSDAERLARLLGDPSVSEQRLTLRYVDIRIFSGDRMLYSRCYIAISECVVLPERAARGSWYYLYNQKQKWANAIRYAHNIIFRWLPYVKDGTYIWQPDDNFTRVYPEIRLP